MQTHKKNAGPSPREWILLNLKIGVVSWGSGGRILLYQTEAVEKKEWLSKEEFRESVTIAQLLPGPSFVNFVIHAGYKLTGLKAGTIAVLCLGIPGSIAALFLHRLFDFENPSTKWLFRGFTIGSVMAFAVLIWIHMKGLKSTIQADSEAPVKTVVLRGLIAALVALAVLYQVPLAVILSVGTLMCFLTEFILNRKAS